MFFCINKTQIQWNMSASFHGGVAVGIVVGGKGGGKRKERVIKTVGRKAQQGKLEKTHRDSIFVEFNLKQYFSAYPSIGQRKERILILIFSSIANFLSFCPCKDLSLVYWKDAVYLPFFTVTNSVTKNNLQKKRESTHLREESGQEVNRNLSRNGGGTG